MKIRISLESSDNEPTKRGDHWVSDTLSFEFEDVEYLDVEEIARIVEGVYKGLDLREEEREPVDVKSLYQKGVDFKKIVDEVYPGYIDELVAENARLRDRLGREG